MNLFHLFLAAALALTFSGFKAPEHTTTSSSVAIEHRVPGKDDDGELIPWTPYRRLSWNDYLCEPTRGTDAVASTSTSLGLSYQIVDDRLTYHITCGFSKEKSWGLLKTEYILAHEQGHFDITEIFARKLNEALQDYHLNPRTFKRDIGDIYQSIVKEKEDYQEMYDGETDHSRNHKLQVEWLDRVHTLLQDSQDYAQYP
jgi:Bacterial protein of unknown function (DUF922)